MPGLAKIWRSSKGYFLLKKSRLSRNRLDLDQIYRGREEKYKPQCTRAYLYQAFLALPENSVWNSVVCIMVFVAIVFLNASFQSRRTDIFDIVYNVTYAVHVAVLAFKFLVESSNVSVEYCTLVGFLVDLISFTHYILAAQDSNLYKLLCYYLRLHRPFRYLWALNDYNLKGSVLGTALKYSYIFFVLRITWAIIWFNLQRVKIISKGDHSIKIPERQRIPESNELKEIFDVIYIINKMFIPIGPSIAPSNDMERVTCLMVMITGCLVVTGAAVASLSLVISIYMRPEEAFRTRYRLIMREMRASNVPAGLREKVETFYKMYWHKQRAVSAAQLLPVFPPSLSTNIYTDIYFKATQKCRILRELSYQFLSEVVKKMETIHYIPGDAIIKRNHKKSSIIYITYGDIEMLTAEDDCTAMLRMIRGTILSPCAGSTAVGSGRAHVEVRAATFCTAHVLHSTDLWKTAVKYGRDNGQSATVLDLFNEHFERVKRHYYLRYHEEATYKSSILHFKRNLMDLKESKDAEGNQQLSETDVMIEIAGCYIMRNRADSSLTDEADAICLRPTFPCILQPTSSLQVVWNSFVSCLILIVCITHPYYMVYKKDVPLEFRFYDYVVTMIYILDLIVYLSTGANVEDGVPITFAQTSSQQARSRWFVLDVVGTLPIFEFISDGHFAGINKLLRLPKVFRGLKAVEDECVYHSNIIRFLSYSLLILMTCYLLAALQQGHMCLQFGYCLVTNFTHSPYWEKTPLDEDTIQNRLTFGLYWAISMMTFTTHLETWGVEKWNNLFYTVLVLEICIVLYIFIEAVYSATIMVTTALREDYDACIENVTNFLIKNEVDPMLRQRFVEYLQLCWYTDKAYTMTSKQNSIFYDLPPHVYQDIVTRHRSKYALCIPFMKLLHKEDLKSISTQAKLFYTSPNEILLNTGDMSNEIYVIKQGICEILSPETKDVVGELHARNYFGVLECLLRLPAFYTVRAVTHVEIFSVSRKHLLNAIEIPKIKDAIIFAKEQPQYTRLQTRREPFLSYQPPEPAPNMERFRLPKKYEQDYAFLHPFYRLGVLSILRYIFPRFTIRPDGRYLVRSESFRACCALLSAMIFPGYTYLVLQWPWLYFITFLLDISAYFDIFQRMLVGYYNEKGILVYHPASTAAHYLKGAFMMDLFGCLPLERLESPWKESYDGRYRAAAMKQFLMLNRLLQLYRAPSALLGLADYFRRDILLVIKAIPLFMTLLNVLTCFIVSFSVTFYYSELYEQSFWAIVPHNDIGGSWIHIFNKAYRFNLTESPWNLHLGSYFWVVYETTTTGYGSFRPTNLNLMRVLITGMLIGAIITTYFSVRIISTRSNVNKALAAFQEHMKDIAVFMKREKLDPQLQKQVTEYYEYNWDKLGGVDYRSVLKLCEQITLRTDAILNIYGPTFAKCPILNHCDASLLRIIGRAVRSFYFLKNTTIIEEDDVIADIYFVDRGIVELKDSKDTMDNLITLPKGSMFGNLDSEPTIRCPVSMTTVTQVHLLQINSQAFFTIIKDFPCVLKLLNSHLPLQQNYIAGIAPIIPFSTKERSSISSFTTQGRGIFNYFNIRHSIIRFYLITICLMCIYIDVYNAGFQHNGPLLILMLYLLDFCFMWKFVIQYFLPQMVEVDDDVVITMMKARKKYFNYEFKYDLLSFIPFEILSLLIQNDRWMALSWLRLNRLLRIVTVYKCLQQHHERISINLTLTTVLSVLIWFTLFIHISTCLWYFIGIQEEKAASKSSWMYKNDGSPWCSSYYICSLYFVLTTFTQNGVGDIMPKKQSEVIFVCLLQVISTMMCMVYVGEFSNIIQYQSFRSFNFYTKYLELQDFLKNNRVSKNLVHLVNKYALHLWRESRGLQLPHFLIIAPNCLRLEVMSAAYLYHLHDNPIFKSCEPAFVRQLVGYLRLYTYIERMYVVKESEITDCMYIVHAGHVKEMNENLHTLRSYYAGQYFGELQGLVHDLPFTHSYKTHIKSQILTLRLSDWKNLLNHFPESKKAIYKYMDTFRSWDDHGFDDGHGKRLRSSNLGPRRSPIYNQDEEKEKLGSISDKSGEIRRNRSRLFVPPPGPSVRYTRPPSIDKPYLWPMDNRNSESSFSSNTSISVAPKLSLQDIRQFQDVIFEDSIDKQPTTTVSETGLAKREVFSSYSENALPSTSKHIDDNAFKYHPRSSNSSDYIKTDEKRPSKTQKSESTELKSVEDYIQEKHGIYDKAKELNDKNNSGSLNLGATSTSRIKKRGAHVRYTDKEVTPSPVDTYDLKPIRDKTTEERNYKSLDSDMEVKKVEFSASNEGSETSQTSETSIKSQKKVRRYQ